ncbi:eCIS core domain-containing protein [Crocosphaera sp.]|uniref:eCIS core domain-containing protein n=1 Tax=Crocosphaera sp. TaxID=2729996 RepID=UPI003F2450AA|nr:DUF4157 domain-containing protein [Crocosphaera sp.]
METLKSKTVNRSKTVQPAASRKGMQCRDAGKSSLQTKSFTPKISSPKDPAEKEANATAKRIMHMTAVESSHPSTIESNGSIFRQSEEEETVQPQLRSPYIARFARPEIFRQAEAEEEKIQRQVEETEEEETVQPQLRSPYIAKFARPEIFRQAEAEEEETVQRQVEEKEKEETVQPQLRSPYIARFARPEIFRQAEAEEEETVQRQVEETEKEETVQTKADGQSNTVTANVAADISSSKAMGSPLPTGVRQFMEPRFNTDFSNVKIHTDDQAAHFNQQLNAKAFTLSNHIFFAKDTFKPDSYDGKELMAHELTHTIQQGAAIQRRIEETPPPSPQPDSATAATVATPMAPTATQPVAETGTTPESPVNNEAPTSGVNGTAEVTEAAAPAIPEAAVEARPPEMAPQETTEAKATEEVPEAETAEATSEGEEAVAGAPEAAPMEKAPASPEEDPAFQAVVKKAKGVAAGQRRHAPATAKAKEAQEAAEEPANALESKAQANQVGEMEKAEAPAFDAVAFKAALKQRIEDTAPKNLEEADKFKNNNKLDAVKGEMSSKVKDEKATSQGPLEEKTKQAPDKSGIEPKSVTKLPPTEPGKVPPKIGAEQAVPKPKTPSEIEAPLQQESQALDQQMAAEKITDEQLAKSNEPDFQTALASKQQAQTHALEAPQAYRQAEQEQLSQAQTQSAISSEKQLQGMHGDRGKLLTQVADKQGKAKTEDEKARTKVASDLQQIYQTTKTKVEGILNQLDGKVERAFDAGAKKAKQFFEDYVDLRMRLYKAQRYSGAVGAGRWVKDKFAGLPDEVNVFYVKGRELYLKAMDRVLDEVVGIISRELTQAKVEIAKGKQEIQDYVAKLPQNLQKVGQAAAGEIQSQFDDLENTVNSKQDGLIDSLAQKYQDNLKAVDERINKMKEANKGLIDKAVGAIKGVIETFRKIKAMFAKLGDKIAAVVPLIMEDPIAFFGNLIKGLGQGFNNFVGNIGKHLQAGLIMWLTGTLGPMGIQIPKDLFSLQGIFSLVMQILGLTWDYIRKKAVKLFGEKVVAAMEKGVEIFQIIRKEGPAGLWKYVKEQFSNLKEMVIGQIKEMVTMQIIQAGVKWILSLLNPVAALVKAAMAIYDIVMFFVERAAQIVAFLNSIIDAVAAIAKGAIGGAAKLVETALAKSIPLIIGLLAGLLGISGIAKKVQKIIQRIRQRIDKAIDKLLLKVKKFAKKVFKGKGEKTKKSKKESNKIRMEAKKALTPKLKEEQSKDDIDKHVRKVFSRLKSKGLKRLYVGNKHKDGSYSIFAEASPDKELLKLAPARRKVRMVVTLEVSGEEPILKGVTTKLGKQITYDKGKVTSTEDLPAPLKGVTVTGKATSKVKSGGLLVPPEKGSKEVKLVTWNTGEIDPTIQSNATHAERQFTEWLEDQPIQWRRRVQRINIKINFSPCIFCASDLARILTLLPFLESARIDYDKRYTQGPLATTEKSLGKMRAKGWHITKRSDNKKADLILKK